MLFLFQLGVTGQNGPRVPLHVVQGPTPELAIAMEGTHAPVKPQKLETVTWAHASRYCHRLVKLLISVTNNSNNSYDNLDLVYAYHFSPLTFAHI